MRKINKVQIIGEPFVLTLNNQWSSLTPQFHTKSHKNYWRCAIIVVEPNIIVRQFVYELHLWFWLLQRPHKKNRKDACQGLRDLQRAANHGCLSKSTYRLTWKPQDHKRVTSRGFYYMVFFFADGSSSVTGTRQRSTFINPTSVCMYQISKRALIEALKQDWRKWFFIAFPLIYWN